MPIVGKRSDAKFCSDEHRDRAKNKRRSEARGASSSCSVPGCGKIFPGERAFVHDEDGLKRTLCGNHHARLYRQEGSGEAHPIVGGYYHDFFHAHIYEWENRIGHNGGIDQLIDHLSGEIGADGAPVPHPIDADGGYATYEPTIYSGRHFEGGDDY